MHRIPIPKTLVPWIALVILMSGCDERVVEVAREAADRQAQQNATMAELQQDVAGGARQLVAADAETRKEIVAVHRDLQSERVRLDAGWTNLERERQGLASDRRTASLLVPLVQWLGGILLAVTLLGFCWYALAVARSDGHVEAELNSLLIDELASGQPSLFGADPRPQIPHQRNQPTEDALPP